MKPLKTPHSQRSLDKKEQSWKHHVLRFQTILQSCSNQTYGTGVKMDAQINGTEQNALTQKEINSHIYSQLIYKKNIQSEKNNPFNKWCWENGTTTCKEMKLHHYLMPTQKLTENGLKM